MYVDKDFFQNRFIEGKGGRRFTMSDKVIMNVFNLTQEVTYNHNCLIYVYIV